MRIQSLLHTEKDTVRRLVICNKLKVLLLDGSCKDI